MDKTSVFEADYTGSIPVEHYFLSNALKGLLLN